MNKILQYHKHNISYDISGQGPAIVFLHGFLETKEIWEDFSKYLSGEFTVIAIDLPGHGGSDVLAEIHTMGLMADVIHDILDHHGFREVVIGGHSLGGYIAGEFASKYPSEVKGLVFFHSHAAPDNDETRENRRRSINIVKQNQTGFVNEFIPALFDPKYVENFKDQIAVMQQRAAKMSAEAIIASIAGMRERTGSLPYLFTTETPVLFIIGKQDPRLSYNVVLAQALIPAHSEVLMLDNVGHMGYLEAPRQTMQTIRHFALKCCE